MSLVVLLVLVGATLGLFVSLKSIVGDDQSRLLQDHAKEAGTVIQTLFQPVGTSLADLAASAPASAGESQFSATARPYVGVVLSYIGVLKADGAGSYRVVASVGSGPAPGTSVSADRAGLAVSASRAAGVVHSQVTTPKGKRMSFALKAGDGSVVDEDLSFDSSTPIDLGRNGPFSELNGALYAGPGADRADVVISTTSRLPIKGSTASQMVGIGKENWLLVVSSRGPLIGEFSSNAPWGALGGGLALTVAVTMLVESVGRRRSYALALVDERTRDLQEARETAEAANRAKSEFLSRMSHELRTPLNAILGFGQLLELDELTEEQHESVEQIVKGGQHLLGLINEVLDISRIEAGQFALSAEPVSVVDAMTDAVALIRPLADERGVSLQARGEGLPDEHVLADNQRLRQVLLNLVSNAVKYTGSGGKVTVHTEEVPNGGAVTEAAGGAGRRLRIVVTDTGPGIRDSDLARLFVPFERLGAGGTGIEGTGVGLALSRRLAEAMGGTVGVASTYGKGSRFWVELPATDPPPGRLVRQHGDAADGQALAGSRRKLLYIEDNVSNLRLVERVIELHSDLELVVAMQGRLGIELAREHRPVAILLDLHLPDVGGEEVLRELRREPATADTPVVVLSADATPGLSERLLASGATDYLTKPVDVTTLIRVLGDLRDAGRGAGAATIPS